MRFEVISSEPGNTDFISYQVYSPLLAQSRSEQPGRLTLQRLFWNQTLITRGLSPVISTNCSFIRASGRGLALQNISLASTGRRTVYLVTNTTNICQTIPVAGFQDVELLLAEHSAGPRSFPGGSQ